MLAKRILLVLGLLLCNASVGWADAQDPAIIVRAGISSGTIVLTPGNLTTTIHFDTDPRCVQVQLPIPGPSTLVASMSCSVFNTSGLALSSLTFTIVPAQLPFQVNSNSFGIWSVNTTSTIATFTFATPIPTFIPGMNYGTGPFPEFAIDFIGFNPNAPDLGFVATPVPEPATLGLFALGLGGAWFRRRVQGRAR